MTNLLAILDNAADKLERVRSAAETAVADAARAYVTAEMVAYSKAHPRRLITFCSAMGTVTVSVQKGGAIGRDGHVMDREYQYGGSFADKNTPAFLVELERLADETGMGYGMTGPRLLEVRGGEIIRDVTHW